MPNHPQPTRARMAVGTCALQHRERQAVHDRRRGREHEAGENNEVGEGPRPSFDKHVIFLFADNSQIFANAFFYL
jgi:hypothetical protein